MADIELPVYDKTGAVVASIQVDPSQIARTISVQLLHDAVVMYQANLRQGSAKSKTRAEVAGHKKKMYKQKGTGNARAGHRRSGVRRGGGHIFAKQPRDWSYRLPRKSLQAATRMALASKLRDSRVVVINELDFVAPKTKESASILKSLGLQKSVLVSVESYSPNVYKSFRNISKVTTLPVTDLNAYEILRSKQLLMTQKALEFFLGKAERNKAETDKLEAT